MTSKEAREYFKNKGLTYDDIHRADFEKLHAMVGTYLDAYRTTTDHAKQMGMTVRKMSQRDKKFHKDKLLYGRIRIDGLYFEAREGITFRQEGFIGFCGEFSSVNSEPILSAFIAWCDYLAENKQAIHPENK